MTDFRYEVQAGHEVYGYRIRCYKNQVDGIAGLVGSKSIKKLAFEGGDVSYDYYRRLKKALGGKGLVSFSKRLEKLRVRKSKGEIGCIRKAIQILEKGFDYAAQKMAPGVRERDLAISIEGELKKNGAESLSFDIIVASGKRSALPHGKASSKIIRKGDLVVLDMGVSYGGYHSDKTRTFMIGSVSAKKRGIYGIVKEAQRRAIEAVRPGMAASELDSIAREYIAEKGYGRYFGHGTGHGIGLEVHEPPYIAPGSGDVLEEGMVFTVEPGIYVPGLGGVRIEDVVLVTSAGRRVLTKTGKEGACQLFS